MKINIGALVAIVLLCQDVCATEGSLISDSKQDGVGSTTTIDVYSKHAFEWHVTTRYDELDLKLSRGELKRICRLAMRGLDEHKDRNENVAAKSIASDNAVFLLLFRILVNDGLHRDGCVDAYGEYLYQKDHGPEWFMEAVTITDTNNKSFQDLCAAFADIRDRELTEKFGRRDPDNHTDTTSLEPRHGLDPCR